MLKFVRYARSVLREKFVKERRSPEWAYVRDGFLAKHPACAACGATKRLQVHHIVPFHVRPDLELSSKNLITLCMAPSECHLRLGHGGSWDAWNPDVVKDAERYKESPEHAREDLVWIVSVRAKRN